MSNENYSKLVKFVVLAYNQDVLLNGNRITQKVETSALCCPECNNILQQFNNHIKMSELSMFLENNKSELTNRLSYCSKCGQKLDYDLFISI